MATSSPWVPMRRSRGERTARSGGAAAWSNRRRRRPRDEPPPAARRKPSRCAASSTRTRRSQMSSRARAARRRGGRRRRLGVLPVPAGGRAIGGERGAAAPPDSRRTRSDVHGRSKARRRSAEASLRAPPGTRLRGRAPKVSRGSFAGLRRFMLARAPREVRDPSLRKCLRASPRRRTLGARNFGFNETPLVRAPTEADTHTVMRSLSA